MDCKPFGQYYRSYHDRFVYKIFLKEKFTDKIRCTLDQAFDIVKEVSNMSGNIPQIVYLVGWSFEGHDSKYPSWSVVGKQCVYKDIPDPVTALRTMMRDARRYNAIISLHINMDDVYENSPLWDEYASRNLINTHEDGSRIIGGEWGYETAYEISKSREWACGLGQKRILELLEMIPEIREAGTIHIDAFRPKPSKGLGTTLREEIDAAKKILTFWHQQGVDVTNEFLAVYELVGYVPMVWALNLDEEGRLKYPPSVLCGGSSDWNRRRKNAIYDGIGWMGSYSVPAAGCLFDEAWGESMAYDFYPETGHVAADRLKEFYLRTLPWHFLNRFTAKELRQTKDFYRVIFTDGVESTIDTKTRKRMITQYGIPVVDDGNICIKDNWNDNKTPCFLFFSRDGGSVTFHLPESCSRYKTGRLFRISTKNAAANGTAVLENGTFTRTLLPGEAGKIELL